MELLKIRQGVFVKIYAIIFAIVMNHGCGHKKVDEFCSIVYSDEKKATIFLSINSNQRGSINIEIVDRIDSLMSIQKYIFHFKSGDKMASADSIILSDEFEDNVATYFLKRVDNNKLFIESDSYLFGLKLKKIEFEKKN